MGIQDWSDDVVLVTLAGEPDAAEEIRSVTEIVQNRGNCDVVVDFCNVGIIASSTLASLLKLRKAVMDNDRSLTFCSVKPQTRNVFTLTGLDTVFEFVDDQFIALATLQMTRD